jgi:hypothetical protein
VGGFLVDSGERLARGACQIPLPVLQLASRDRRKGTSIQAFVQEQPSQHQPDHSKPEGNGFKFHGRAGLNA